jgi:hypothetical protein
LLIISSVKKLFVSQYCFVVFYVVTIDKHIPGFVLNKTVSLILGLAGNDVAFLKMRIGSYEIKTIVIVKASPHGGKSVRYRVILPSDVLPLISKTGTTIAAITEMRRLGEAPTSTKVGSIRCSLLRTLQFRRVDIDNFMPLVPLGNKYDGLTINLLVTGDPAYNAKSYNKCSEPTYDDKYVRFRRAVLVLNAPVIRGSDVELDDDRKYAILPRYPIKYIAGGLGRSKICQTVGNSQVCSLYVAPVNTYDAINNILPIKVRKRKRALSP